MAASYDIITEQIQLLYGQYTRDKENRKEKLDKRYLKGLVEKAINKKLKIQTKERFEYGFTEIPRTSIATYDVSPSVVNGVSEITLPVIPISLPMDMGVYEITPLNDPFTSYIPIPAMETQVMQGTPNTYLEGQTGFTVEGNKVRFTKDIGTTDVKLKILVHEMDEYTDSDALPITADIEIDIINEVLSIISNGRISLDEKDPVNKSRA